MIDVLISIAAFAKTKLWLPTVEIKSSFVAPMKLGECRGEGVVISQHRFKYRLFYGKPGQERVRYDNERGKGDHRHLAGQETEYEFVSVEKLLDDFDRDLEAWSMT